MRLRVAASGLNRADLLQRAGLYPPPPGVSLVPGLECAGTDSKGQRWAALLAGGAHQREVEVDPSHCFRVPDDWTWQMAAAIPEAWITAYGNLYIEAGLRASQTVLIHAAGSGVGTAALQLAKRLRCRVVATTRSVAKADRLRALGADEVWVAAPEGELRQKLHEHKEHFDVVLDTLGGSTLAAHCAALKPQGCWVSIALMAGRRSEIDLAVLLQKRLRLIGSTLRSRPDRDKAMWVAKFERDVLPSLIRSELVPVIDRSFAFDQIEQGYDYLASNASFGKVLIDWEERV